MCWTGRSSGKKFTTRQAKTGQGIVERQTKMKRRIIMAVINGMDVNKIKQLQDQVKKDPTAADREPKIEAHWLGGSASRIEFGDVVSKIGGDGNLNAMQTLLAALSACDIEIG